MRVGLPIPGPVAMVPQTAVQYDPLSGRESSRFPKSSTSSPQLLFSAATGPLVGRTGGKAMVANQGQVSTSRKWLRWFDRGYWTVLACVAAWLFHASLTSRYYPLMWGALSILTLAACQAIASFKSPSMSAKCAARLRIVEWSLRALSAASLALGFLSWITLDR